MKFYNKPNPVHIIFKSKFLNKILAFINKIFKRSTRLVWESRSVAANLVVLIQTLKDPVIHILVSKRGPNAADFQGKMNLVAGYLDWNESGAEAAVRECWEETGLDLVGIMQTHKVLNEDLSQPWHVKTDPKANRENISLRYGVRIKYSNPSLPALNVENNEVPGEVEDPMWIPITDIDKYEWAFGHDGVIKDYLKKLGLK